MNFYKKAQVESSKDIKPEMMFSWMNFDDGRRYWDNLTHSFPMHPFSTLFRGYRKDELGTNGLKIIIVIWNKHIT